LNFRKAGAGCGSEHSSAATWTGLAIDLDGSLKRRFRPDALGATYLDELRSPNAPLDRRARIELLFVLPICAF
jgi:hypothetical protein